MIMKAAGQTLSVAQVVFLDFLRDVDDVASHDDLERPFKTDELPLHFARSALLAMGIFLCERSHRRTNCRGDDVEFHHIVHPSLPGLC